MAARTEDPPPGGRVFREGGEGEDPPLDVISPHPAKFGVRRVYGVLDAYRSNLAGI
jgi:hypothetical protein